MSGDESEDEEEEIADVTAVGVFVNRQMILKVFPESGFEGAFKSAYKDFKSECLSFLREVEEKDDLLVRDYKVDREHYTMSYAEVGDKESVFLMRGRHENGFPATDTLHVTTTAIMDSLSSRSASGGGKNNNNQSDGGGGGGNKFSSIEEVFRTMDLEGTGAIDEAEFSSGLSVLGLDWKDSQIRKLFGQIDDGDDGEISFDNFMRFMQKASNKKSWKELKRAINSSIAVPTTKSIQESGMSPEKYQKKLSQMEKMVNMMEEAMVEAEFGAEDQRFWRNKIFASREFIRRHQDVVGRAMGQENNRLKKRLTQMERRMSEQIPLTSLPAESGASSSGKKGRKGSRSGGRLSLQLSDQTQQEVENQALIKRLRRENQEFKRKIQQQQQEIRKAASNKARAGSATPRTSSRRGSGLQLDQAQMEEMLGKLKKENYELRTDRNKIRKERDELRIQLKAAKDRLQTLGAMSGEDDALLRQLAQARRDAKGYRKDKMSLQAGMMQLTGINQALKRKLMRVAKRVGSHDPAMSERILSKKTANEMIDELASQLISMIDDYELLQKENENLKRELREQAKRHASIQGDLHDEIAELKRKLQKKGAKMAELKEVVQLRDDELEELREQLQAMEALREKTKKQRRKINDLKDEIEQFHSERENAQRELSEAVMRANNFRKQLKMLEKMPGNATMLRKIERLYKIFQRLDEDNDGYLRLQDFAKGAADLGFGESREEQEQAFEEMDADGDGLVDFEAFKEACLRQMENAKSSSDAQWKTTYKLLSKPPSKWNNEEVNLWLSHIGLDGKYNDEFDNVDGNMLINMKNAKDLKNMGVQKNAHVRKMMREIKDLKARDDLLSNLNYENGAMKAEISNLKAHGPTWEAVHLLQRKVRDLDGQLRREKYARENIMISVKDQLSNDDRFDNMSPDYEDVLAEVALLKGALHDANQQMKSTKKAGAPHSGSEFENMSSPPEQSANFGKPIGRFLQKWYVLANHSTQYWISRTNAELQKRDEHYKELQQKQRKTNGDDGEEHEEKDGLMDDGEEDGNQNDGEDVPEFTEALDWIFFDTRQKRIVSELRMSGRGAPNDPKDLALQMSVSPSGPWTNVVEHQMENTGERQRIGGFSAEARFWRVVFMSNYGEQGAAAPRYVLYECQFWGPLDEDVENNHFVIE